MICVFSAQLPIKLINLKCIIEALMQRPISVRGLIPYFFVRKRDVVLLYNLILLITNMRPEVVVAEKTELNEN